MWVYKRNLVADGGLAGLIFEEVALPNEQFRYKHFVNGNHGDIKYLQTHTNKAIHKKSVKGLHFNRK